VTCRLVDRLRAEKMPSPGAIETSELWLAEDESPSHSHR
jgi:hypothetical protein